MIDDVESLNAALIRSRTRSGRSGATDLRAARRSTTCRVATLAARRSRPTRRSRSRCARSTGSRCAAATRPACTCSSPATVSTSPIPTVARIVAERRDPLFAQRLGAHVGADGQLAFVYKTAAEIGELGDNTAALRAAIRADDLLRLALRSPARAGHRARRTRAGRASASSPSRTRTRSTTRSSARTSPDRTSSPRSTATSTTTPTSRRSRRCASPAEITTDAKVIPALVSRRIAAGADAIEAFRATVASFEGSVAIAAASPPPSRAACSSRCAAAARRSTSGCADDASSSRASRTASSRVRPPTCGSTARRCSTPATRRARARSSCSTRPRAAIAPAITRRSYDGTRAARSRPSEWVRAEITTRDVDRGDAPHYLLKEITEAPASFRKTLRGKIVERDGVFDVRLPPTVLPDAVARPPARRGRSGGCS